MKNKKEDDRYGQYVPLKTIIVKTLAYAVIVGVGAYAVVKILHHFNIVE